jgi:hypothetical protein
VPPRDDRGAAVVEFVLVGVVLLLLFLGVVQVGIVLHVRAVLAADAAEGARHAANLGRPPGEAGPHASALAARSLSPAVARALPCRSAPAVGDGGVRLVEVRCEGDLPLRVLPLGALHLAVRGRAVQEVAP